MAGEAGEDLDLKVKWRGAPEFSSADGKFKMKVRGRLEVDYNNIDQDPDITFTPDVSATQLRRARLGIEGVIFYDFKYLFEVDFAGNSTVVRDAYLEYTGLDYVDIRVGNFKTYNSLEHLMSANYITFMERPAFIEAFGIDRQIGGGLSHAEKNWTASAGIFGDSVASSPQFPGFDGEENLTFAARATVAPIAEEGRVLHFGASVRTRDVGDDQPFLQYQARAADLALANRFVNTGRDWRSPTTSGALEAAGVCGAVLGAGRIRAAQCGACLEEPSSTTCQAPDLRDPRRSSTLHRANSGTSVRRRSSLIPLPASRTLPIRAGISRPHSFLTGETKPYDNGVFGRVKVLNPVQWGEGKGGWGAWQIAGRYDTVDLSDAAFNDAPAVASNFTGGCANTRLGVNQYTAQGTVPANPIRLAQCGEQETWALGVNWYLNDYVKLLFNYTESDLSQYPTTTVTANTSGVPTGTELKGFDNAKIRGFGMRAHVDW